MYMALFRKCDFWRDPGLCPTRTPCLARSQLCYLIFHRLAYMYPHALLLLIPQSIPECLPLKTPHPSLHRRSLFSPLSQTTHTSTTMSIILARGAILYLAAVNTTSAVLFAYDKFQASTQGWRVSEKTLCKTALAGGWIGGLLAMHTFRHKTRKASFQKKYVAAIGTNAAYSAPAVLVVAGVPALRRGFANAWRQFLGGFKPPRNPPRFRR